MRKFEVFVLFFFMLAFLCVSSSEYRFLHSEEAQATIKKNEIAEEFQLLLEVSNIANLNTLGFKNNNPCNVKTLSNDTWQGQIGQDEFNHVIFENYLYSLRACARILRNYQEKHGIKTIHGLISRYCEDNKDNYMQFISKKLGVGIHEEINFLEYLPKLLECIVIFENGSNPYPEYAFHIFGIH